MKRPYSWLAAGFFLASATACAFPGEAPATKGTTTAHPAPGLNHLYVVLDAETFAAIRDSAELPALLGRSDGGLPNYQPPAADADRVFFRGRMSYLELFAPDNRFGEPVGKVGLALGLDDRLSLQRLSSVWGARCGAGFRTDTISYRRVDPPVPWYESIQCDETAGGPRIALWAMAYRPEFARWQTGNVAIDRAAILAPSRDTGQGRFDVHEIALDVLADDHERLLAQLAAAGLERTDDLSATWLKGNGWTLKLRRVEKAPGLRSVTLTTDGPRAPPLALGRARIESHDTGRATIRIDPPDGMLAQD